MQYTIQFCGPSKDFFASAEITLHSDRPVNASELKKLLLTHRQTEKNIVLTETMLNSCVFASGSKILNQQEILSHDEKLFLLPPVCGG